MLSVSLVALFWFHCSWERKFYVSFRFKKCSWRPLDVKNVLRLAFLRWPDKQIKQPGSCQMFGMMVIIGCLRMTSFWVSLKNTKELRHVGCLTFGKWFYLQILDQLMRLMCLQFCLFFAVFRWWFRWLFGSSDWLHSNRTCCTPSWRSWNGSQTCSMSRTYVWCMY